MRTRCRLNSVVLPIFAWLLIGLMSGGLLIEYLTTQNDSAACLEERVERVLESEDGRFDLSDAHFIAGPGCELASRPVFWAESFCWRHADLWSSHRWTHSQRGPPGLG